jgi:Cdc6-like AAA superfamily ATPase
VNEIDFFSQEKSGRTSVPIILDHIDNLIVSAIELYFLKQLVTHEPHENLGF